LSLVMILMVSARRRIPEETGVGPAH